jgi:hypothetical protein
MYADGPSRGVNHWLGPGVFVGLSSRSDNGGWDFAREGETSERRLRGKVVIRIAEVRMKMLYVR